MNSPKDKLQELKRKIDHYQVGNSSRINSSKKKGAGSTIWVNYFFHSWGIGWIFKRLSCNASH